MFPFTEEIINESRTKENYLSVLQRLEPQLTDERKARIDEVLKSRTFDVALVLENLYDRGNISAVMRSAEAFGFAPIHLIELGEKFKESQRTTAGADKWLEVQKWKSTASCIQELKKQGKQVVVTCLSPKSIPIAAVDFSKPTAIVLGNEKEGVSQEMIALADHQIIIPMAGFVQSFNISVAAALCCYHAFVDRKERNKESELSLKEKEILKAIYYARTRD